MRVRVCCVPVCDCSPLCCFIHPPTIHSSIMSSAALSNKLTKLIKKTTHHDKDERFMSLSDISTELDHPDCPPLEPPPPNHPSPEPCSPP